MFALINTIKGIKSLFKFYKLFNVICFLRFEKIAKKHQISSKSVKNGVSGGLGVSLSIGSFGRDFGLFQKILRGSMGAEGSK